MERHYRTDRRWTAACILGAIAVAAFLVIACDQPGGQAGDLAKKPPPSLGAISSVDGSDEGKDEKKTKREAQQPGQPAAGSAAPKQ